jgi:hypothetical protein
MRTQKLLRRKAASDYLREAHGLERAPSTLAKLAVIGGGPIFRRAGRIPLYSPEDLDAWAESLLSAPMRSTSEHCQEAHLRGVSKQVDSGNNRAPTNAGA